MDKFIKFITNEKFYLPIIYVIIGLVLYFILKKVIDKITNRHPGTSGRDKKKDTIINLCKSIFKYLILIFVVLGILKLYGIDTTSIIASLGVFAAVIGLAFQDIIKDLLAGITILFENKYAVGDTVSINGFKGEVIHLGLKTTKLKSYTGEVKIIANRNITEVVNYNLANSLAIVDFQISYEADTDKAENILIKLCEKLTKELTDIKGDVTLLGVTKLDSSGVEYRITVETIPLKHYEIERKILKAVKLELEQSNITIPYPQVVVHNE